MKKTIKPNRQYFFRMIILLDAIGPKLNLSNIKLTSLRDLLITSHFVSQVFLETFLYSLKISDRGRVIFLDDFDGQLEFDSRGTPFWNVYLKTTALITPQRIAKTVSKELYDTDNLIDPTINIRPLNNFEKCDREKLLSIPESDYYPGHFNKTIMIFDQLIEEENEKIREAIQERPEKYTNLITFINMININS